MQLLFLEAFSKMRHLLNIRESNTLVSYMLSKCTVKNQVIFTVTLTSIPMQRIVVVIILAVIFYPAVAQKKGSKTNPHILNPSPTTIAWGHYWSETPPALKINSGDI